MTPAGASGPVRRLLVVRLSSLGDVVRATGCVRALRAHHAGAELVVVTKPAYADTFRHETAVDRLLLSGDAVPSRFGIVADAVSQMSRFGASGGFDLAVDLQGTGPSAAWVYASRARVKAGRGGWRPGWRFAVRTDYHLSDVAESAAILRRLGIDGFDASPRLVCGEDADRSLATILAERGLPQRGFLVVNPFSRWVSKTWPTDRFAALLPRVKAATGIAIVVSAGAAESAAAARLIATMPPDTAASLAGCLTLGELFCLLRRAALVLTGDSGPMHAAAALGTRVVALFGPTWPERAGPNGDGHVVLQRQRCARYHAYRDRAGGGAMAAIGVDEVHDAVVAGLGATPQARVRGAVS